MKKNNLKKGIPNIDNVKSWKPRTSYEIIEPNNGCILASIYYHKIFVNGWKAISNDGIQKIDNKDWEIFFVSHETKNGYFCTPLEGLGLVDVFVYKEDIRPFTESELNFWSNKKMGMYGSHTGTLSRTYNVHIEPCKSKFDKNEMETT